MSTLLSCDTILGHTPNRMSAMTPMYIAKNVHNSTIFIGPKVEKALASPDRRTMACIYTMEYFTDKKELTIAHNKRHITERNKLDTKEHAHEILFIRRPKTGKTSVKEGRMIVTSTWDTIWVRPWESFMRLKYSVGWSSDFIGLCISKNSSSCMLFGSDNLLSVNYWSELYLTLKNTVKLNFI